MTAWVPEPLDATAGRPERRSLWARAAWRWSLLAGLSLHVALVGVWWMAARHAEPLPLVQPMQVRLTERAVGGQAGPASDQRARRVSQAAPSAGLAPRMRAPVDPPLRNLKPSPSPEGLPPPSPIRAAPVSTADERTPVVATPAPASLPAPSPAAAVASGPAATSGEGAARQAAPLDMPSSAIAYLVKPVLTFPPGSEDLGESGSVTLRVLVDERGVVSTVQRLKSSGFARLDQHAAQVIRQARFKPHMVQGEARAAWATVTLNFNPS